MSALLRAGQAELRLLCRAYDALYERAVDDHGVDPFEVDGLLYAWRALRPRAHGGPRCGGGSRTVMRPAYERGPSRESPARGRADHSPGRMPAGSPLSGRHQVTHTDAASLIGWGDQ